MIGCGSVQVIRIVEITGIRPLTGNLNLHLLSLYQINIITSQRYWLPVLPHHLNLLSFHQLPVYLVTKPRFGRGVDQAKIIDFYVFY